MKARPGSATTTSKRTESAASCRSPAPPAALSSATFSRGLANNHHTTTTPHQSPGAASLRGGNSSKKPADVNYAESLRRMRELLDTVEADIVHDEEVERAQVTCSRFAVDDMIAKRQREREEDVGVLIRSELQEFADKTSQMFSRPRAPTIAMPPSVGGAPDQLAKSLATGDSAGSSPVSAGCLRNIAVAGPATPTSARVVTASKPSFADSARVDVSMRGVDREGDRSRPTAMGLCMSSRPPGPLDMFEVDDVQARKVMKVGKKSPFVMAVEGLSELSFTAKGMTEDVLVAVENAEELLNKLAAQKTARAGPSKPAPVDHGEIVHTQREMVAATEKISDLYSTLSKFRKGLLKLEHDVDERDRALGPMESLGRVVKEELTAVKQERDRARRDLATHKASVKFRALLHRTRERASYYERTNPAVIIAEESSGVMSASTVRHPAAIDPMRARLASDKESKSISPALTSQPVNSAKNALRSFVVPSGTSKPNSATAADREEEEQQLTHCIANVDVIVATVVHICIEHYEQLWQHNPLAMQEATRLFCRVVERVAGQAADRGRIVYRSGGDVPHSNFGGYHLLLFKSPKDAIVFASTLHYALLLVPWPDELLVQDRPIFGDTPPPPPPGATEEAPSSDPPSSEALLLEKLLQEFDAKVQSSANTPPDASFAYDTAIGIAQKICAGLAMPPARVTNILSKNAIFRGLRAKVGVHTGVVFVEGSLKTAEPGSVNVEKNQYSFRPANSRSSNTAAMGDSANPYSQDKHATDDVYGSFNARVPLLYGAATMKAAILCGLAHGGETLLSQASHNATRGALEVLVMLVRPVSYLNTAASGPLAPVVPVVGTVLYSLFEPQEVVFQVLPSRLYRRALHFQAAGNAFAATPTYNPTWWLPFNPFAAQRMGRDNSAIPSDGEEPPQLAVAQENIILRQQLDDARKAAASLTQRTKELAVRARAGIQRREQEETRLMLACDQTAVEYIFGCVATRAKALAASASGTNSQLNTVMALMTADAKAAHPASYAAQLFALHDGVNSQTSWLADRVEAALTAATNDPHGHLQLSLHDAAFAEDGPERWASTLVAHVLVDAGASAAALWERSRDASGLLQIESFMASNRLSGLAVQSQLVQFAIDLSSCAVAFLRTRSALSGTPQLQETIYGWNRFVCAVQNSDGTVGGTLAEHLLVHDDQWAQRRTNGGKPKERSFAAALLCSTSELIQFAFAEHTVGGGVAGDFEPNLPTRAAGGALVQEPSATAAYNSRNVSPRAVDDRDFEASRRVVASAVHADYRPLVTLSNSQDSNTRAAPSPFLSWQHTQSSVQFSVLFTSLSESQFPYSTILVGSARSEDLEEIRAAIKQAIGRVVLVGKEARQLSCYFLPCFGGIEQLTMGSFAKHESTIALMYPLLEQQQSQQALGLMGSAPSGQAVAGFVSLETALAVARDGPPMVGPKLNAAMLECWSLCLADAVNALHQCNSACGFISPQTIFLSSSSRPLLASRPALGPSAFLMEGAPLLMWHAIYGQIGRDASGAAAESQLTRVVEILPPEVLVTLADLSSSSSPDPEQCASRYLANWVSAAVGGATDDIPLSMLEPADVWMAGMTIWLLATGGVSPFSALRLQRKARAIGQFDNVSAFTAPDPAAAAAALLALAPSLDIIATREEVARENQATAADGQQETTSSSSSSALNNNIFGSRGNLMRQLRLAMSSSESGGCACYNIDQLWRSGPAPAPGAAGQTAKGATATPTASSAVHFIETVSLILLCDLLHGMLKPIPEARITIAQVLAHPFFSHVPSRVVDRMATEKVFPQYVGLGISPAAAPHSAHEEEELPHSLDSTVVQSPHELRAAVGMVENYLLDSSSSTHSMQAGQTFSSQVEAQGPLFQVLCGDYAPQSAAKRSAEDLAGVMRSDGGASMALRSVMKDSCWGAKVEAVRAVLSVDTFTSLAAPAGTKSLRGELSPYMIELLQQ